MTRRRSRDGGAAAELEGDAERHAGALADGDDLLGFGKRAGHGFLHEDRLAGGGQRADGLDPRVGRRGEDGEIDVRIGGDLVDGCVDAGFEAVFGAERLGAFGAAGAEAGEGDAVREVGERFDIGAGDHADADQRDLHSIRHQVVSVIVRARSSSPPNKWKSAALKVTPISWPRCSGIWRESWTVRVSPLEKAQ